MILIYFYNCKHLAQQYTIHTLDYLVPYSVVFGTPTSVVLSKKTKDVLLYSHQQVIIYIEITLTYIKATYTVLICYPYVLIINPDIHFA
jgi:hypothetical protein